MRSRTILAGLMLSTLQETTALAGTIHQWLDEQGQVHFGDIAPTGAKLLTSIPLPDPSSNTEASGLRPTETEVLLQIMKRSQQHAQRAQDRRLQNNRNRAEQREHCDANKKKLHASTGEETYKQYSRYLRNHCW